MAAKRPIRLAFDATCSECGARLPAGSLARYYGRGRAYGIGCHPPRPGRASRARPHPRDNEPLGLTLSRFDRFGVYVADGTKLGSTCGCIDYPCCGH